LKAREEQAPSYIPGGQFAPTPLGAKFNAPSALTDIKEAAKEMRTRDLKNLVRFFEEKNYSKPSEANNKNFKKNFRSQ